TMPPGFELY
nr:Chain C, PRRSV-NSP9-TMP9 peptide [Porcine reproductive and respiratory syndrome virus]